VSLATFSPDRTRAIVSHRTDADSTPYEIPFSHHPLRQKSNGPAPLFSFPNLRMFHKFGKWMRKTFRSFSTPFSFIIRHRRQMISAVYSEQLNIFIIGTPKCQHRTSAIDADSRLIIRKTLFMIRLSLKKYPPTKEARASAGRNVRYVIRFFFSCVQT